MAHANAGATGANGGLPQVGGAAVAHRVVPQLNAAVLPQVNGAGVRAAGQAAAPVAGPLVAPMAGALFPQGLVPALFDVDGGLLGPVPTKSNENCKILPKIAEGTGP